MPDYKKMYYTLFNAVSGAVQFMQDAQCETEEIFISADDEPCLLLEKAKDKTEDK